MGELENRTNEVLAADDVDGERGASAVEYALLVAFIAIVVIGGVTLLGDRVKAVFENNDLLNALL